MGRGKEGGQRADQAGSACEMLAISPNLCVPDPHAMCCRPSAACRRFSTSAAAAAAAAAATAAAAAAHLHGVCARGHNLHALRNHSGRQDGGGGGAVARKVVGASSGLHQEWDCKGLITVCAASWQEAPAAAICGHLQSMYSMLCSHLLSMLPHPPPSLAPPDAASLFFPRRGNSPPPAPLQNT